jgi:YggT family protein
MEGIIRFVIGFLAWLTGLYSLLIIIRIIITWFGNVQYGKPVKLLARITDPYLDWWRRNFRLRAGILDLSPIAAITALTVVQTVCSTIVRQNRVSLGIILAICLSAIWSAASFILGFCLIVLILRFIAYMCNSNMYSPFWQIVDSVSKPLLYHINRIIFGSRIVRFTMSIFVSIAVLAGIMILGRFVIHLLIMLLG